MAKNNPHNKNTLNLSQQALDFYHLKQQVFSAKIVDSEQAYSDTSFEQLLDNLKHHLQFSNLILIVEGIASSGKSTLFHQLLKNNIDNTLLLPIQADSSDNLSSLQKRISTLLAAQHASSDVNEQLKNLQLFDQSAALIIDDAQLLSDDCLVALLDYQQQLEATNTQLKLLFFTDTGTAERLCNISYLQENQLFIQSVPELTNKQIAAFIQHCFSHAGYTDEIDLSREAIIQIEKESGGNIYQVMQQAVIQIEKHVSKQQTPASRLSKKIILPIALILLLFIIFVLMQTQQSRTSQTQSLTNTELLEINNAVETDINTKQDPITPNKALVSSTQTHEPQNNIDRITTAPIPADNSQHADSTDGDNITAQAPAATTLLDTPLTTNINSSTANTLEKTHKPVITPAASNKPKETKTPLQPKINTQHPALTKLKNLGVKDGHWLMQQKPEHWTLQILGARDASTLLKFAKQHQLSNNSAWYATRRNGQAWYVLVHRLYSNRETARQAISQLPKPLQKSQPWAKSIVSIQQNMVVDINTH